jgi:hypothetical protein
MVLKPPFNTLKDGQVCRFITISLNFHFLAKILPTLSQGARGSLEYRTTKRSISGVEQECNRDL